ncbi:hypothetical protein EJ06DRAFT_529244 [Trichodelitschia bisporula]|uniref:Magnesium transporter n=1 Tax=Trichodelitschia bisporula TaxID=703511 RepID=A0A6G1HYY2_9PEZI|nr:hypothetical protein EJ06DRAFT_529244 [Trichodelitschia bisporula]
MGTLTAALSGLGLLLLTHAVYSAHEHSTLHLTTPLPTDIAIELLLSTAMLCVAIVLRAPALRPVEWSAWAGQLEGGRKRGVKSREEREVEGGVYGVVRVLQERAGFADVRVRCV